MTWGPFHLGRRHGQDGKEPEMRTLEVKSSADSTINPLNALRELASLLPFFAHFEVPLESSNKVMYMTGPCKFSSALES